jgi:hypothetical protein
MIFDAMTYSVTAIVVAMSFIVILLAAFPQGQQYSRHN